MMRGSGGHWNRAGRRSGGTRPTAIIVPVAVTCGACQATTAFGLLPERLIDRDVSVKCCPTCGGVLLVQQDTRWVTAPEFRAQGDS